MKKYLLGGAIAALLGGASTTVSASNWSLGGDVSLTSDYYARGLSETQGDPALQAGITATHGSGFYVTLWGSNVSDNNYNGADLEVDFALGWSKEVRPNLSLTMEALMVRYPGTSDTNDYFEEYMVGVDYDFGGPTVAASVAYSNNMIGSEDSLYWVFEAGIPMGPVELGLHYGITRTEEPGEDNYEDWAVGISKEFAGINVDLSYMGTANRDAPCTWETCDDRAVLTLTKEF